MISFNYRSEIDGLRALAVIPVILFHAGLSTFSGGFVGVDVFFVISGYLISSLIISEIETGNFSIIKFYERRARRILPALFFVIIICIGLAWIWLLPNEMRRFSQSLVATSLFASNILFYKTCGYFCEAELSPLLHTWSLSIEEQFYIIFPLFLIFTWRLGKTRAVIAISAIGASSLFLATYYSSHNPSFDFLMLPTRVWELFVGVLATIYLNNFPNVKQKNKQLKQLISALGFFLILYSIFLFNKETPHPSFHTLIPTLGTLLIILCATKDTFVGNLLSLRVITSIGLISYSTYLWHHPLFVFARHRSIEDPSKLTYLLLALLALVLGYFSWRFIEKPFRNKTKFSRSEIFRYSFFVTILFLTFGLIGHFNEGFPSRFSQKITITHITRLHDQLLKNAGCTFNNEKFNFEECVKGNRNIQPKFALIGDSHGQALTHELDKSFNKSNISFIPFVKPGCPLNFYMEDSVNDSLQECTLYQRALERELKRNNDINTYIIFSSRDRPNLEVDENVKKDFESNIKSIKEILALDKKVILIYPSPVFNTMISDYMSKNLLFHNGKLEMITIDSKKFENRIKYFYDGYDSIGNNAHLNRVRTDLIFCNSFEKLKCVSQSNGIPLYYDNSHLSNEGAKLVVDETIKFIN